MIIYIYTYIHAHIIHIYICIMCLHEKVKLQFADPQNKWLIPFHVVNHLSITPNIWFFINHLQSWKVIHFLPFRVLHIYRQRHLHKWLLCHLIANTLSNIKSRDPFLYHSIVENYLLSHRMSKIQMAIGSKEADCGRYFCKLHSWFRKAP